MFELGEFTKARQGGLIKMVLLDAPHAARPGSDKWTGPIVERAASAADCHCIVSLVSRRDADLNRPPDDVSRATVAEYRRCLERAVTSAGVDTAGQLLRPFLHLSVHGMHDRHGYDVELGTRNGATCSADVEAWAVARCEEWAEALPSNPRIVLNQVFVGDPVLEVHRSGDPDDEYGGFGDRHHTIQIEFAHHLREGCSDAIVEFLSTLAAEFGRIGSGIGPA